MNSRTIDTIKFMLSTILTIALLAAIILWLITPIFAVMRQDTLNEIVTEVSATLKEQNKELREIGNRIEELETNYTIVVPTTDEEENEDSNPLPVEDSEEAEELIEQPVRAHYWDWEIGEEMKLPDIPTNTFRCMDYRTITNKASTQYAIQQECYSNLYNGIRCFQSGNKVYYCAALAGAYGINLGDTFKVTLENDVTFDIILADFKHDISNPKPDDYGDNDVNYDGEACICVIEFVYDSDVAPKRLISAGTANEFLGENCSIYGHFCNVKSMFYTGNVWGEK